MEHCNTESEHLDCLYLGLKSLLGDSLYSRNKVLTFIEEMLFTREKGTPEIQSQAPPTFIQKTLQQKRIKSPLIKLQFNLFTILIGYPIQKFNDKLILFLN